jgi:Ribosomal protein L11 methyltransferase (PrmA)
MRLRSKVKAVLAEFIISVEKNSFVKLLFRYLLRKTGTGRLFKIVARFRRMELTERLISIYGNCVQSGPFVGMELPDGKAWRDGDRAPKLLGCYEASLHAHLLKAVERAPGTVVNVGCAEGYYAVGLARLLPDAEGFAFDINPQAVAVCDHAAEVNGVSNRLVVNGLCTTEILGQLVARGRRPLIFMDCEGGELELLDPARVPLLVSCDIIVETHDFLLRSITATLLERLRTSHTVELVGGGARDPNKFVKLESWWEFDRWLLVDEGRPETMNWLVCWANN